MATTKKKISVEIGVASLIENPLEEHKHQVVQVNYPYDDLGHTMRNAEEPMTSSDWDSEEKNLSQDSPSEDSDCYFCQRHKEGHDTSEMYLGSDKDCYFCQRCHAKKKRSANGYGGHGSEFAEDSEDPKSLDDSGENLDEVNGHTETGVHDKLDGTEGTEGTEVVKDIQHSSFKYRRVESSEEKHVWEREEIEGDAKVTDEPDVILNSVFSDEDLEVSDLLSTPVLPENTEEVIEDNKSEISEDESTENSQDIQNPVSSFENRNSENLQVIQNSVFEGGDFDVTDTTGIGSKPEHVPNEKDMTANVEDIDNVQLIQNSVFTGGEMTVENSQAIKYSGLTTEMDKSTGTSSVDGVHESLIEHIDSKENEMEEEVPVTGGDTSQLNEDSHLGNYDNGEYRNYQEAQETPQGGENIERSVEHEDNNQINNSVFTVDHFEDEVLSPGTDILTDVSTCGSESNDNDTGVNFDVSAACSIKTDDEHDLTKDSAIVLDSPGSLDFSQTTDMSLGDVTEDTNEMLERQHFQTRNSPENADILSGVGQSDPNTTYMSLGDVTEDTNEMMENQHFQTKDSLQNIDILSGVGQSDPNLTYMSLGDLAEDTNEMLENQHFQTKDSPRNLDPLSGVVQSDPNGTYSSDSLETMKVTNMPGNLPEFSSHTSESDSKAWSTVENGVELNGSQVIQEDFSESAKTDAECDINLDNSKDANIVEDRGTLLDINDSLVSSLSTDVKNNINVQSIPIEGSSVDVKPTLMNRSAIPVENYSSTSYQTSESESNQAETIREDEGQDIPPEVPTIEECETIREDEGQDIPPGVPTIEECESAITSQQTQEENVDEAHQPPCMETNRSTDQENRSYGEDTAKEKYDEICQQTPEERDNSDSNVEGPEDQSNVDTEGQSILEGHDKVAMEIQEVEVKERLNVGALETLSTAERETAREPFSLTVDEVLETLSGHPENGNDYSVITTEQTMPWVANKSSETTSTDPLDLFGSPIDERDNNEPLEIPVGLPETVNDSFDTSYGETEPIIAGDISKKPKVDHKALSGSLVQSLDFPVIEMKNGNLEVDELPQSELEIPFGEESSQPLSSGESKSCEETDIQATIPNDENEHLQSLTVCHTSKDIEFADSPYSGPISHEVSVQNIVEHIDDASETKGNEDDMSTDKASPIKPTEQSEAEDENSHEEPDEGTSVDAPAESEHSELESNQDETLNGSSLTNNNLVSRHMDPVLLASSTPAKQKEKVKDDSETNNEDSSKKKVEDITEAVSEPTPEETQNNLDSEVMDPVLLASSTPAKAPEKVKDDSESSFLSDSCYDPPLFVSVQNMVESFANKENDNDETLSDQKSSGLSASSENLAGHVKSNISIFSKPDEVESFGVAKTKDILSTSDLSDKSEKMSQNMSKFSKSMPNLYTVEDSSHDLSLEELKNRRKPFRAIKDMFEKRTTEISNISDRSPYRQVTYRSRTFISLSTSSNPPEYSSRSSIRFSQSDDIIENQTLEDQTTRDGQVINRGKEEKRYSDSFGDTTDSRVVREVNVQSMGGGSAQQNGYDKEEVQYSEMSSVRNAFESGGPQQNSVPQSQAGTWDDQEEGVFENEPVKRSDVARESDRDIGAGLPEVGMAKNLLNRFSQIESEPKDYHKEVTPPRQVAAGKVEFESEPAPHIQVFEGKAEAGIFESEPQINPDVVRSGEVVNEPLPERGTAKNIASKFKQLESGAGSYSSPGKREITPDRSAGKVEFVSEPKTTIEKYEGKAEAGIFENQPQHYEGVVRAEEGLEEILPERGTAKNIAQRFKQMESGSGSSSPRGKREITPDKLTRGEYVSEPRAHVEVYEGKAEAGVFESQPQDRPDVVKSDQYLEETLPERGFARNVAAKFKEMESNVKSPPPTPGRVKEFTPPRETGVFESQPQFSPDVISENAPVEEIIPEKGYAKNLVSRFKQIEEENSKVAISNRKNKEFTPPRAEAGVFENEPKQFIPDYNQKTDSGISENNPESRNDVFKETDPAKYEEELPERGTAKNLVSRWKQMESKSGNQSPGSGGRVKEFTPPREEERVKALRTAKSPAGHFESVQPGDLPGQYHQSNEPSMFESEPEMRSDVFREADTDWTDGMPKENAAKKRIEKFKQIQANANKEQPKPVSRKEDGDRNSPENEVSQVCERYASDNDSLKYDNGVPDDLRENQEAATPKKKGGFFIPTTPADKCGACQKTVYAMERFEMNKVIYHKNCFRCSHCKSKLTPKTFAVNNGIIYCTNHLMQLFKSKGNYDEGFGREQHKKKWLGEGARDGEQEAS